MITSSNCPDNVAWQHIGKAEVNRLLACGFGRVFEASSANAPNATAAVPECLDDDIDHIWLGRCFGITVDSDSSDFDSIQSFVDYAAGRSWIVVLDRKAADDLPTHTDDIFAILQALIDNVSHGKDTVSRNTPLKRLDQEVLCDVYLTFLRSLGGQLGRPWSIEWKRPAGLMLAFDILLWIILLVPPILTAVLRFAPWVTAACLVTSTIASVMLLSVGTRRSVRIDELRIFGVETIGDLSDLFSHVWKTKHLSQQRTT